MPDFTTILQDPIIRQLVQENYLTRVYHDALFPNLPFRTCAELFEWPAEAGDDQLFTRPGIMAPALTPLTPGVDPAPQTVQYEQWAAHKQDWGVPVDIHMPSSVAALASQFIEKSKQLGLGCARSLNRLARNALYNAGLSGQTVAVGAHAATATLNVARLNGFTQARAGTSPVRFAAVSAGTPLAIEVFDTATGLWQARNVTAFAPTNPGDETGPGTLTLSAVITCAARDPVRALDRANIVRVGGGNSVDSIGAGDILTPGAVRQATARLRNQNVLPHEDGTYHLLATPGAIAQLFADTESQRLFTSLPDSSQYQGMALGKYLGCTAFEASECPQVSTVAHGGTDAAPTFSLADPFAGELVTTAGQAVDRAIVCGAGAVAEHYDLGAGLLTEAGVTGKVGEFSVITNGGIEVQCDRCRLIYRAPINRRQDLVSAMWSFIGAFVAPTDVATGDAARYKRMVVIEHAAS